MSAAQFESSTLTNKTSNLNLSLTPTTSKTNSENNSLITTTCKWATSSQHHEQQLGAHIAVHTPIHASPVQSSLPSYSSGSPQTGFHVPIGYAQTGCTTLPYRQMCYENITLASDDKNNDSISVLTASIENSTDSNLENFVDQQIKLENNTIKDKSNNSIKKESEVNNAETTQNTSENWLTEQKSDWVNNITSINNSKSPNSFTQQNQRQLLSPEQKQQHYFSPTTSFATESSNDQLQRQSNVSKSPITVFTPSNKICSTSTPPIQNNHAAALAAGIAAPQPIRSSSPFHLTNNNNLENARNNELLHTILDYVEEDQSSKLNWDKNEASKLLLDFAQTIKPSCYSTSHNNQTDEKIQKQEKQQKTDKKTASLPTDTNETLLSDRETTNANNPPPRNNRAFFRAPGLEAPNISMMAAASSADSKMRMCLVCGFTCSSKFHYNSHMNTHGDHQCTMCNYTSRTEGRLRKHMRDSHTREQRIAAGLDYSETPDISTASSSAHSSFDSSQNVQSTVNSIPSPTSKNMNPLSLSIGNETTSLLDNASGISTTMASIVDIVNRAAAAAAPSAPSTSTEELLRMVDNCNSNDDTKLASITSKALLSSYNETINNINFISSSTNPILNSNIGALDQIKALTERANNLLSPNSNAQFSSAISGFLGMSGPTTSENRINIEQNDIGMRDPTDEDDDEEEHSNDCGDHNDNLNNNKKSDQPSRRSGRPKTYRCRQCAYISTSKEQSWMHNKTHIPLDKQLTCKECGFVTEYKHHFEYHLRNHTGSKPFKCTKCAYTCVNKSMLNSHMKSHTPIYQYRCQDCTYQTKYCHSLKMHLEKYRHTRMPGPIEMDSDGEEKPISEGDNDEFNGICESDEIRDEEHNKQIESDQSTTTTHSALNSMILQPMVNSVSIQQYANQMILRHQQMEHVNELIRAANPTAFACNQSDHSTTNNEELIRHSMAHLIANQQQQQNSTPTLANLYQNIATAQQQQNQIPLGQHQQHHSGEIAQQNQQNQGNINNNSLFGNSPELIIDSSAKELAAQLQQELLRAQLQQHQEEEEKRRQAVAAALAAAATVSNVATVSETSVTNLSDNVSSALANALLNNNQPSVENEAVCDNITEVNAENHNNLSNGTISTINAPTSVSNHLNFSSQFASSTTTSSSFGCCNDDEDLQLPHSLSPVVSNGRRGSMASESTSGRESTSKTCSASPGSETLMHNGARKRKPSKTNKVDQISVKLRSENSRSVGLNVKHSKLENGELIKKNNNHFHQLGFPNGLIDLKNGSTGEENSSNFTNILAQINRDIQRQNTMPHSCQHCMIAFSDRALYQIHLGYHGYEIPFKCNRCGHLSDSSLEFNLHLYQAKHD